MTTYIVQTSLGETREIRGSLDTLLLLLERGVIEDFSVGGVQND
jgi:hypothetical protein